MRSAARATGGASAALPCASTAASTCAAGDAISTHFVVGEIAVVSFGGDATDSATAGAGTEPSPCASARAPRTASLIDFVAPVSPSPSSAIDTGEIDLGRTLRSSGARLP